MTKDEALKLALEALTYIYTETTADEDELIDQAITAIKEALANVATNDTPKERVDEIQKQRHEANVQKFLGAPQPEQEPVAWPCLIAEADFSQDTVTLKMQCNDYKVSSGKHWLYTTPPQRTWVGLTDEEIGTIAYNVNPLDGIRQFSRAIETKLKERNT